MNKFLQFNCKLVRYCNIKFTGSKCCLIFAKAYSGHLEIVKYFAVNLNVFDCCKAYYIVMHAIIESGYRTKTVQKNKNYMLFSDIENIPMIMIIIRVSLSDLLTLSQV